MTNYYIACDNSNSINQLFKFVEKDNIKIWERVNEEDAVKLLFNLTYDDVIDAKEMGKCLQISFENVTINIDNVKLFKAQNKSSYGFYLSAIFSQVKERIESGEIKKLKAKYPQGEKIRINRNNNKFKATVASGLLLSLMISSYSIPHLGKIKALNNDNTSDFVISSEYSNPVVIKDEIVNDLVTSTNPEIVEIEQNEVNVPQTETAPVETPIVEEKVLETTPVIIEDKTVETPVSTTQVVETTNNIQSTLGTKVLVETPTTTNVSIEYAFDDRTNDGRLDTTLENCTPYLEPLIERYGLPKDITYALTTTEYGKLDTVINSGGACGPMQLQVAALRNEFFKVPVYKNGKMTGEYDEFYVGDSRYTNGQTTLNGKPILYMQNLVDNFKIGCALFRRCIDKYENLFVAIDAYNKGLYAMELSANKQTVNYYKNNPGDFSWIDIIPNKYGRSYGAPRYINYVLSYLDMKDKDTTTIDFCLNGEAVRYNLTNTNVLNNTQETSNGISR